LRSRVERRLPALSSFSGHKPAQEMRCADVWNRDMSTPSSDTIAAAMTSLIPVVRVLDHLLEHPGSPSASPPASQKANPRPGSALLTYIGMRFLVGDES
jgi:hypothetical protein